MTQCQGITSAGTRCKRNTTTGDFCASHQDQAEPTENTFNPQLNSTPSPETHIATLEIQTTTSDMPCDRMLRYRKTPPCPKCCAHPVVCKIRRRDYALFRCRACGHRFEIDRRVDRKKEFISGREGNILFKLFQRVI